MLREHDRDGFQFQQGDILFIEENNPQYFPPGAEKIFRDSGFISMDDKFLLLKQVRIFENVKGVVIGKSKNPNIIGSEQNHLREIIQELNINVPVLANVSCSHTTPMITLPLGRTVTLDADNCTLCIHPE